MEKIILSTENAPRAIGPYSQAVRVGQLVFISGQLGIDPQTGILKDGIDAQTRQVLDNIGAILASLGLGYAHVVKTTIFLRDFDDYAKVNEIYGSIFQDAPPARSTVEVSRLPKRASVEIECIAIYPEKAEA
ncbi:MAG: RidA family protein [Proteobacteria bacterium]|nr:RidA family protein [Pseudomonadota bacterium]